MVKILPAVACALTVAAPVIAKAPTTIANSRLRPWRCEDEGFEKMLFMEWLASCDYG